MSTNHPMIKTGGSGGWEVIDDLLGGISIPRMVRVRQKFRQTPAVDVAQSIAEQFSAKRSSSPCSPDRRWL